MIGFDEDPEAEQNASDLLDQTAVMELAAAIARGDMHDAASSLDVVFRDDEAASEWIAQARCSNHARSPATAS